MGKETSKDWHLPFEVFLKHCLGTENLTLLRACGGLKLIHHLHNVRKMALNPFKKLGCLNGEI